MPRPSSPSSTVADPSRLAGARASGSEGRVAGVALAAVLDVLVVAAFALVGRRSHDEALTLAGWWQTAWPFLAGLTLGWLAVALMVRRAPTTVLLGLPVWVATVGGGMALRDMTNQGTALPFVAVATLVLGVGLVGWRVAAALVGRWRSR